MSADTVRALLTRFIESNHEDLSVLAEDMVYTNMATGEEHRGREAARAMLQYIYHGAFDAHAELRTLLCDAEHAVLEATFVGRHIGDFAGVPATGKKVHVPLCVVYDIADDRIKRARIYFELPAFLAQVRGAESAAAAVMQ
ncbi:MAG TPA: ester cyclase [Gemmatimonadales bacterium]|nr:ester cyclase [Gemmatimonadales bacterium]